MTGAAAAGGGASAASSGGSGPAAGGGAFGGSSFNGASFSGASYSGASFGDSSTSSQGRSSQSSSQVNTYTLEASRTPDLSQASFPSRGSNGAQTQSSTPSESSMDPFADLTMPMSSPDVVAALTSARNSSGLVQVSPERAPVMDRSLEGEIAPEVAIESHSPRDGAARAERGAENDTTERTQEARPGEQAQRARETGIEIADLDGAAFSKSLSPFRAQGEDQSKERSNSRRGPEERIDEEDELTKRYQKILNNLVESNIVSEDVASMARGKKGNDLAAAVGAVMVKAAEQALEASREQARRGAEEAERGALQSSSSQSQNDWTQSKAA